jgi:hypothetical protein
MFTVANISVVAGTKAVTGMADFSSAFLTGIATGLIWCAATMTFKICPEFHK